MLKEICYRKTLSELSKGKTIRKVTGEGRVGRFQLAIIFLYPLLLQDVFSGLSPFLGGEGW